MNKFISHLRFVRNPVLIGRILSGYFNTSILGRDTLRSIELAVTYQCQANCHKCYSANLKDEKGKDLAVEEIRTIIEQALRLGIIHVNITGGEPTLRNDLTEIIKACQPKKIMVSLVTNALNLSFDKMKEFKRAGLNTIQISLDSADSATHDKLRGVSGCYDRVMKGAFWARELGINLCFSTVMSTEESSYEKAMKSLLELARKEKAFLLICDSAEVGGWANQRKMMDCEERDKALGELMKHPNARHHNMYNFRMKAGCPAGIEKIYITAYGDVTPCDLIHQSFGNVLEEPLSAVWKRMCSDPRFRMKTAHCLRYLAENDKYNKYK